MTTQLRAGTRTTRKPHKCWHCAETIEPGTAATFQTNADRDYGGVYTLYLHPECDAACQQCDEFHYGECTGGECRRGSDEAK